MTFLSLWCIYSLKIFPMILISLRLSKPTSVCPDWLVIHSTWGFIFGGGGGVTYFGV